MATAKSRPAAPKAPAERPSAARKAPAAAPKAAAKAPPAAPKAAAKAPAAAPKKATAKAPAATPKKAAAKVPPAVAAHKASVSGASAGAASPAAARKPAPAPGAAKGVGAAAGLSPGQPAPAFSLPSDGGDLVSLRDFDGKTLVLYFYPKDDTPGCTREACAFQGALAKIEARGAVVVGVSRDTPASHVRFKAKYGLNFPLLSDRDGAVHQAYGAWGVKRLYGRESIGPLRTTVVVDGKGRIARVFPNVRVDGHADEVVGALGGG
jgi:thioredoxin-dependent peroxiredoxin